MHQHKQQSDCVYQGASLKEMRTLNVAVAAGGDGRRTLQFQAFNRCCHLSRHALWKT
jgi:hypothetical protein